MSIEKTIVSRSQPYSISTSAAQFIKDEAHKGCSPVLSREPLRLEPIYTEPTQWKNRKSTFYSNVVQKKLYNEFLIYNVWISDEYDPKWFRAERFIKILSKINNRISFQISGNSEEINLKFHVFIEDADSLQVAFYGEYNDNELTISKNKRFQYSNIFFRDYFPVPPYHHLLTRAHELATSPFEPFILALSKINSESVGFVQVLFEPVRNNWHQNVEILTDLEFLSKTINDTRSSLRVKQQVPSGDIRHMASEVESKAHNDKPFFSVALRTGVMTE